MLVVAACFSVCVPVVFTICASQAALVKFIHVRLFNHYAEL
jgi:hypothetical protein